MTLLLGQWFESVINSVFTIPFKNNDIKTPNIPLFSTAFFPNPNIQAPATVVSSSYKLPALPSNTDSGTFCFSMEWEQTTLLGELTRGKELVCLLRQHLHPCSSPETPHLLLQELLCSYEKALSMLNPSGFEVETKVWGNSPGAPASLGGGAGGVKKRKISSLEVPLEDGYCWRKYGQKDILGSKFPRGYYRCTHRHSQGCLATKQVQRSDDDPTIFEVRYKGRHTCNKASHFAAPPLTAEAKQLQQEEKLKQKVNKTEDLDDREGIFPLFSFQFEPEEVENGLFVETLASPSTSDLTEIMSVPTSVTNSPIGDLDFKELDQFEFDPSFPFVDNLKFF